MVIEIVAHLHGLDQTQVRHYQGWKRHVTLTVSEAQRLHHLFTTLIRGLPLHTARARMAFHLRWSIWRRGHQASARWHHYRTRYALIA